MSQFFEALILSRDFWENVHHHREISLISSWKSEKVSFSSERNKLKEIRFCKRKPPEDDNLKINVSPNIPCAFLLFKASYCLQAVSTEELLKNHARERFKINGKQIINITKKDEYVSSKIMKEK